MGNRKTLLGHFWNEEYLLPWWIKHHREMFDDAILIDWHSTDRSVHEIRKHAPSGWKVVTTRHKVPMDDDECFALALDAEVMEYEAGVDGWRMCLNTTEFLLGDINKVTMISEGQRQVLVGCMQLFEWNPEGSLDWHKPLWRQKWMGRDCRNRNALNERSPRSLHNFPFQYTPGRHFFNLPVEQIEKDLVILHYANCISSPGMLKRRLQIQQRITKLDRSRDWGSHHFKTRHGGEMTADDIKPYILARQLHNGEDLRPIIDAMLK